mgnify:CR=1 FL=1
MWAAPSGVLALPAAGRLLCPPDSYVFGQGFVRLHAGAASAALKAPAGPLRGYGLDRRRTRAPRAEDGQIPWCGVGRPLLAAKSVRCGLSNILWG